MKALSLLVLTTTLVLSVARQETGQIKVRHLLQKLPAQLVTLKAIQTNS